MNNKIAFANNLRYYREKSGLTQMELAEKLGYTSKSVSKWESGNGLPTLSVLTEIAQLFSISLDCLVYAKQSRYYLLGIDGGGSNTVFKLTDQQGTTVKTLQLGSSNPNDVGMESALTVLKDGIQKTCQGIPCRQIVMFAGISGGGMSGDNATRIREFFSSFGFRSFENGSDVENVVALVPQNPCILVIMGTGFITYRLRGEKRSRIAGWGQFFDPGGSGYSVGRDCITAALQDIDGSGESTLLTKLLEQRLGQPADQHIPRFYRGGKQYIASFSDIPFQAAGMGDLVARQVLESNMAYVAKIIQTAQNEFPDPVPVYFSGGLSKQSSVLFPMIQSHFENPVELIALEQDQIDGALVRAKCLLDNIEV